MSNKNQVKIIKLDKNDLRKVFIRNLFGFQWGWNYELMQGLGYAFCMMPIIRKLYGHDKELKKKALNLHLGFFNTSQAMSSLIIGANLALEDEIQMDEPEAITGLKTGLMGPFAGIGDTIFIAIYRTIVFSIAAYLALEGQSIGLIIPVIAGIGIICLRWKFIKLGFAYGKKIATEFADKMNLLTEAASILGLTVVGALVTAVITFQVELDFVMNEVTFSVQDMLDKIMPGLVPTSIVLFSYWLLGKKKINSTKLIFILITIGMLLGNLQEILNLITNLFQN